MIYESQNYKEILKIRIKELQKSRSSLTMKNLAVQLGIQSTYFSKFFNQATTHLNDDHLFLLAQILGFDPTEIDYLYLLKSYETSAEETRRTFLLKKIESLQKDKKLNAKEQASNIAKIEEEMNYFFDPICSIVHQALYIDEYRNFPIKLCDKLGITNQKFKQILRTLSANEYIELTDHFEVKELKANNIHYSKNHPLMRVHQALLKTKINSELIKVSEEDKKSLLVTFTSDEASFEKMKDAFQSFLKDVEKIAVSSKDEKVYQLNFDLFKWL